MTIETVDPSSLKARDALRAAQLYYMQDLTMETIARELHTSRSSVSRLLSFAREAGLVQISIHSPLDLISRLQHELQDRYGVTAHVVPVPDRTSDVDRLERVALSAARILTTLVDSNMRIGLAWGSTVSAVARHLPQKKTHNTHLVQLNGAANERTSGIPYAGEILNRFALAFGAEAHQFSVPALFDDPATKEALWRERSIRRVLELQRRLDLAVFGLGSPVATVPSHVYAGDYFDARDRRELAESGVVGDVATVFYRADGSDEGIGLNARSSGPSLEVLRGIPRRFCIVSGVSKARSLGGALAAGVITDLVVDEQTARHLVDTPSA
ncbi:DNA-binding transcriptional regulator LsrR (DeoR family) [Diaminobutyricimonas aerilata]|uniref:DNA-binding transcriptional regulator LsrR (DeoR family) n=1 Tax=Diaminobutyricimonas aerilata TaxID=1162967 RepID=A0A2M9CH01_9MICO|nr:sugar-binding domain-containing protein [Diaminobutyricimonas aerilata]PJJ71159.1 DNA-binding transcriptional regulator LsrR (DeoR family) [Diaminobutyricimonas aerilata]